MRELSTQIDCETCPVRGLQCDDCMVTAFLTLGSGALSLDATEQRAVDVFATAGLISTEEAEAAVARPEPGVAAWASAG